MKKSSFLPLGLAAELPSLANPIVMGTHDYTLVVLSEW